MRMRSFLKLVSDYLSGDGLAGATLTGNMTNNAPGRLVITTDITGPDYSVLGAGQMLSRGRWIDVLYPCPPSQERYNLEQLSDILL